MTRARRDLRWREQAARLIYESWWPPHVNRHWIVGEVMGGRTFDVARVREHCQRLIAEADDLDIEHAVFVDWTRARGMGPENRKTGAFDSRTWWWPGRYPWREGGSVPPCVPVLGTPKEPGVWYPGKKCGGWPGNLAREYAAMQRSQRRCSRKDCDGGWLRSVPPLTKGDAGELLSLVRQGKITAADARDIAIGACPECQRFTATRTTRTFASGGNLRRAAQRLLDTLDGRCPWAPEAEAQLSQCDACDGRGETGPEWPIKPGTTISVAASPGVRIIGHDGRPRDAKIGEQLRAPCHACSGTGHNLRGVLPPLPAKTVERLGDGVHRGIDYVRDALDARNSELERAGYITADEHPDGPPPNWPDMLASLVREDDSP